MWEPDRISMKRLLASLVLAGVGKLTMNGRWCTDRFNLCTTLLGTRGPKGHAGSAFNIPKKLYTRKELSPPKLRFPTIIRTDWIDFVINVKPRVLPTWEKSSPAPVSPYSGEAIVIT